MAHKAIGVKCPVSHPEIQCKRAGRAKNKHMQLKKHKVELDAVSLKGLELLHFFHVCSVL